MMGFLIAALVLMLVAGPVLWLKPSKGEARRTQLRLLARGLGLQVRLCNLPQVRRARVRREDARQGIVYLLPVPEPGKLKPIEYCLTRENGSSPWEADESDALPADLQLVVDRIASAVPADVVAIGLNPQGPALYWRERGDEATVRSLAQWLQALRNAMLATLKA